ncbi:MAG: hypothetical protein M1338_00885 [Patescibacteria group bacterium]|nr:hypothetical protein [Patescibacteria group bacterium]
MTLVQIIKSISKKEWFFVLAIVLVIITITTLPLVYGLMNAPQGSTFTGVHFSNINDWFVYYSYIEQIKQGSWLLDNLTTAEPQTALFNPLWLGVGLLARTFNLSVFMALNLARIILIPILYFVAYLFIAYLLSEFRQRKLALIILSFASGLGLFLINALIKNPYNFNNGEFTWPMDLWVPELSTFMTVYYTPHFIASLILILLVSFLTVLFVENKKLSYGVWSGLSALILFSFHPFHILTIYAVVATYFLTLMIKEKKWLWHLIYYYLILLFLGLPSIVYHLYLLVSDPVIAQKAVQNNCLTTPLKTTFFSYGLLLIFSLAQATVFFVHKKINYKWLFLIVWGIVQFCLLYFPVNYQRRMTEGLQFPMVILTTVSLLALADITMKQKGYWGKFLDRRKYFLVFMLAIFLVSSNLFELITDIYMYRYRSDFVYLDRNLTTAMDYLKSTSKDAVIFNSSYGILNFVPAYSGRRVYVGHGVETPFFRMKQQEVDWFFATNRDNLIERNFLVKRKINYIFYSEPEKQLGDYNPDIKPYLKKVYSNSEVAIYQVI